MACSQGTRDNEPMNIPNALTLFRMALIPVLVVVFWLPFSWSAMASAAIFVLAAVTDWLDGYLARKLNQSTSFGAFLDPVADKLMVAIALVLMVGQQDSVWFTLPALVVVAREILVSALREWMADIGKRGSVKVSFVGKVKTTVQMIAITVLLAVEPAPGPLFYLGYLLLYVAVFLTIWSAGLYIRAAWQDLSDAASQTGA
jgi:CDP-diacylglycerol--glycerol-3-phosphate 3-phosphatidyltransferase